jgi:hypothetical protein
MIQEEYVVMRKLWQEACKATQATKKHFTLEKPTPGTIEKSIK